MHLQCTLNVLSAPVCALAVLLQQKHQIPLSPNTGAWYDSGTDSGTLGVTLRQTLGLTTLSQT